MRIFLAFYVSTLVLFASAQPMLDEEEAGMKAEMALIDGERFLMLENYSKALEMFEVAKEIRPEEPAIHYKIAQVLVNDEEYDKALASAEQAIKLNPTNSYYLLLAANIEISRADLKSSEKWLKRLLELPETEEYLYNLLDVQKYQGDYKGALETVNRIQDYEGITLALLKQKRAIYQAMGEKEMILNDWQELINKRPWEIENKYLYAEDLIFFEKESEAKDLMTALLNENPADDKAKLILSSMSSGDIKTGLGEVSQMLLSQKLSFEEKVELFKSLLNNRSSYQIEELKSTTESFAEANQDNADAQALAGDMLFQLNDKLNARRYYERASELNPGNFVVWQNILSLNSELNDFKKMEEHADKAMLYFPSQAAVYYLSGQSKLQLNKTEEAKQMLEMGLIYATKSDMQSLFYSQLGVAYHQTSEYSESESNFKKALEIDKDNEHALKSFSLALSERKINLSEAVSLAKKLLEKQNGNPLYQHTLAFAFYQQGKFKESEKLLKKASEGSNKDIIAELYGDTLYQLGKKDEALQFWKKALQNGGDSNRLKKKIENEKIFE